MALGVAVLFLLAGGHSDHIDNLKHLLRHGYVDGVPSPEMWVLFPRSLEVSPPTQHAARRGAQLNKQIHALQDSLAAPLPELPAGARYLDVDCSSSGAFREALFSSGIETRQYEQFIFMDSRARGPFHPVYSKHSRQHWALPFVQRITSEVKLVGPSISCEGRQLPGHPARHNPHVQVGTPRACDL
jgi:hypothetical protein